jgi:hypothetical protein
MFILKEENLYRWCTYINPEIKGIKNKICSFCNIQTPKLGSTAKIKQYNIRNIKYPQDKYS